MGDSKARVSETAKAIFTLLESKERYNQECPTTGAVMYKVGNECTFLGYKYALCENGEVRVSRSGKPDLVCTLVRKNGSIEAGFEAPGLNDG